MHPKNESNGDLIKSAVVKVLMILPPRLWPIAGGIVRIFWPRFREA